VVRGKEPLRDEKTGIGGGSMGAHFPATKKKEGIVWKRLFENGNLGKCPRDILLITGKGEGSEGNQTASREKSAVEKGSKTAKGGNTATFEKGGLKTLEGGGKGLV